MVIHTMVLFIYIHDANCVLTIKYVLYVTNCTSVVYMHMGK